MNRIITFVALICIALASVATTRKAIYIVVDGVTADNIERMRPPVIFDIARHGHYSRAYCGGKVGQYSETPTISAIGYTNILTGTWLNKHNVNGNSNLKPNYNYWTIFRIAKEQKRHVTTALFSSWTDNRTVLLGEGKPETGQLKIDYVRDGYDLDTLRFPHREHDLHIFDIDAEVCRQAAQCVRTDAPDLSWVYLWYTDDAYHMFGDSKFSDEYVMKTDSLIGQIWEAVQYRQKHYDEQWMVIVLTDHGRDEYGYDHGGQSLRARTTWVATNVKKVNRQFAYPELSHVDINPSICSFMGFEVPRELEFERDGTSFIGRRDIYGLTSSNYEDTITLSWKCDEARGNVDVYMSATNHYAEGGHDDWQRVATVAASDGSCTVDVSRYPDAPVFKFAVVSAHNTLTIWNPRHPGRKVRP